MVFQEKVERVFASVKGSDAEPAVAVALRVLSRAEVAAKMLGVKKVQGMADARNVRPARPDHEALLFSRLAFVHPAEVMGDGCQAGVMKCGDGVAPVLMADRNASIHKSCDKTRNGGERGVVSDQPGFGDLGGPDEHRVDAIRRQGGHDGSNFLSV